MKNLFIVFCAAILILKPFTPVHGQAYGQIYALGDLSVGGLNTQPNAINNSGVIVGLSYPSDYSSQQGFVVAPVASGGYGTPVSLGAGFTGASSINDSGQIAGFYTGNGAPQAYVLTPDASGNYGAPVIIGPGYASHINNSGQVVGTAPNSIGQDQAFIASPTSGGSYGAPVSLGSFVGDAYPASTFSSASSINNAGVVVGYSATDSTNSNLQSFVVSPNANGTYGPLVQLANLGFNGYATAINSSGQIAGNSQSLAGAAQNSLNGQEAFIVSPSANGTYGPLTNLEAGAGSGYVASDTNYVVSSANGINDSGAVVGFSDLVGHTVPALWTSSGALVDLNAAESPFPTASDYSGFQYLTGAYGINNAGDIIGTGLYLNYTTGVYSTQAFAIIKNVIPVSAVTTVAAAGNYSSVTPVTATGGLGTQVALIDGVASSTSTVTLASTAIGGDLKSAASDVFTVSGNAGDKFTVQLTFNLSEANQLAGGAAAMQLLWYGPTGWENAVFGNTDLPGEANNPFFVNGAYDPNFDFQLGYYGVDLTTDTVWAVIDHNSEFVVGSNFDLPSFETTPEPSTWAMLLGGLLLLGLKGLPRSLRKKASQA